MICGIKPRSWNSVSVIWKPRRARSTQSCRLCRDSSPRMRKVRSSRQEGFEGKRGMADFTGGASGKESTCSAGDLGLIPGLGRSPGGGKGNPRRYSCLVDPIDRGAWRAMVHRVAKSQTRLKCEERPRGVGSAWEPLFTACPQLQEDTQRHLQRSGEPRELLFMLCLAFESHPGRRD